MSDMQHELYAQLRMESLGLHSNAGDVTERYAAGEMPEAPKIEAPKPAEPAKPAKLADALPGKQRNRRLADFVNGGQGIGPQKKPAPVGPQPRDSTSLKSWFGKSKIVDEKGEPLTLYHGTTKPGHSEFRSLSFFTPQVHAANGYAGSHPSMPNQPRGGAVYPVHLRMENPWRMNHDRVGEFQDHLLDLLHDPPQHIVDEFSEWIKAHPDYHGTYTPDAKGFHKAATEVLKFPAEQLDYRELDPMLPAMKHWLMSQGHDGIIRRHDPHGGDDADEYINFHPHQVKSATGNRGTYDPADDRLDYSASPVERYAVEPDLRDELYADLRMLDQGLATPERYAEPHWITIGEGKDIGEGTHVKIDQQGRVVAGPQALEGRSITNLREPPASGTPAPKQEDGDRPADDAAPPPAAVPPEAKGNDQDEPRRREEEEDVIPTGQAAVAAIAEMNTELLQWQPGGKPPKPTRPESEAKDGGTGLRQYHMPILNATACEDPPEAQTNIPAKLLPLHEYDKILVQYSGGKDSTACVLRLLELGVPKEKIVLWHQRIDGSGERFFDWPVTEAYCEAFAKELGLELRYQWRDKGFEGELTKKDATTAGVYFQAMGDKQEHYLAPSDRAKINTREKWPAASCDLTKRWCSPILKIQVSERSINNDPQLDRGKFLFVTGERREEGGRRSKYLEAEEHRTHAPKKGRHVDHWRPVIDWTEKQVWDAMKRHGINPHPAYKLGYGRLSCQHCVFADSNQVASSLDLDRPTLEKIAAYEKKFGHYINTGKWQVGELMFESKKEAAAHQEAIRAGGEEPPEIVRHEKVTGMSILLRAAKGVSFVKDKPAELKQLAMSKEYTHPILVDSETWELPAGAFKRAGGPDSGREVYSFRCPNAVAWEQEIERYRAAQHDQSAIATANATSRSGGAVGGNSIILRWIKRHVSKRRTILDMGAGRNAVQATDLKRAGYRVTAYEYGKNFDPKLHDPKALDRTYDVVYASNVLNVQDSPQELQRTIGEAWESTKPGGYFVANVPSTPRKGAFTGTVQEGSQMVLAMIRKRFGRAKVIEGGNTAPVILAQRTGDAKAEMYAALRMASVGVERYQDHWITIGEGRHTGEGTHVKIDDQGTIVAGPDALAGRSLTNLGKSATKPSAKAEDKPHRKPVAKHQGDLEPDLLSPPDEIKPRKRPQNIPEDHPTRTSEDGPAMHQPSIVVGSGQQGQPTIVSCGVGRDSVAMLVRMKKEGWRPDAILFANVGSEKKETYEYIPILRKWLKKVGFPDLTIVRYEPDKAPYRSIEGNMVLNATLPGATFNRGSCTMKFKIEPQNKWVKAWGPAQEAWAKGQKVLRLIGFEADETGRLKRADAKAHSGKGSKELESYDFRYPLMEWGMDLNACIDEIASDEDMQAVVKEMGLPAERAVPAKSACYFCPNQQTHEVEQLSDDDRARMILMELCAEPYNRKIEGLWRRPRKSDGRPGSITEYILQKGLTFTPLKDICRKIVLNPKVKKAVANQNLRLADLLRKHGQEVPVVTVSAGDDEEPGLYLEDVREAPMDVENEIDYGAFFGGDSCPEGGCTEDNFVPEESLLASLQRPHGAKETGPQRFSAILADDAEVERYIASPQSLQHETYAAVRMIASGLQPT